MASMQRLSLYRQPEEFFMMKKWLVYKRIIIKARQNTKTLRLCVLICHCMVPIQKEKLVCLPLIQLYTDRCIVYTILKPTPLSIFFKHARTQSFFEKFRGMYIGMNW